MRVIVIDNFDSFVFNLVQLLGSLGASPLVFRNDAIDVAGLRAARPDALVVSPGPGRPEDAGVAVNAIRDLSTDVPTLGVCLGHQAIATAFGGAVEPAAKPRHGKPSTVVHDGSGLFAGIRRPFAAARYHSLVVREAGLPRTLRVTAWASDDARPGGERVVMGIAHVLRPVQGVQFHPESILTPEGPTLIQTFLEGARAFHASRT